jgi:hypothetical protein
VELRAIGGQIFGLDVTSEAYAAKQLAKFGQRWRAPAF